MAVSWVFKKSIGVAGIWRGIAQGMLTRAGLLGWGVVLFSIFYSLTVVIYDKYL
ncbi:MAG: hypothetical protein LBQ98_01595 [Nitrososphaerota archaeon]|jgi:hypothetical protein|nr:hypothetical protein [Nitrososphaerota archaeon]